MRTTININDEILEKAAQLTGIKEKTALVRMGLEALIARESSRRLAKLGGTEKQLTDVPRRSPDDAVMVLVDTSIWINHLRSGVRQLENLLSDGCVWIHPFIVGELACGNLKNRSEILALLQTLPTVQTVTLEEYLFFIESHGLSGVGIGFVDVHLLAAARMSGMPLWTEDKRLRQTALTLGIAY